MSMMECSKCFNHYDSDYEGHTVDDKPYCDRCVPPEGPENFLELHIGKYWNKICMAVRGCTPLEPACDNCFLAIEANMRMRQTNSKISNRYMAPIEKKDGRIAFAGGANMNPGEIIRAINDTAKGEVIFYWSDLFHEDITCKEIYWALEQIMHDDEHIHLILTKRAERMANILLGTSEAGANIDPKWYDNVYFGATIADQAGYDKHMPWLKLLSTPGGPDPSPFNVWISHGPALGPIEWKYDDLINIQQIITEGESGNKKTIRPMHPEWAWGAKAAADKAAVRWFFKQWGEFVPVSFDKAQENDMVLYEETASLFYWHKAQSDDGGQVMRRVGKKAAGRVLDGETYNELAWHK